MEVRHVSFGARERLRLVEDDRDRRDLLGEISAVFRGALLAYCVMDTHAHVIVEADAEDAMRGVRQAFDAYARNLERRGGRPPPLLRGAPAAMPIATEFELMRAIRYVHENPCEAHPPLASRPIEWRWSSAREFAGLALVPRAELARTMAFLGPHAPAVAAHAARGAAGKAGRPVTISGASPAAGDLAGLDPAGTPSALPEALLAAVADAYGLLREDLAGRARDPLVTTARATFVRLGRLESYSELQLGACLGRSQSRASRLLARAPAPDHHVRVARTLLRELGVSPRH